jgi:hypothetical protein
MMVETNLKEVVYRISSALPVEGALKSALLREIATSTLAIMRERIHEDGKNADGAAIGTYSEGYMATRRENNRGGSSKIIMALTDNLQQSYLITELGANEWAISVSNVAGRNYKRSKKGKVYPGKLPIDKLEWNNTRYGAPIWELTEAEKKNIQKITNDFINKLIK